MRVFLILAASIAGRVFAATSVESVKPLSLNVSPAPVLAQLQADLAILSPVSALALPPSAILATAVLSTLKTIPPHAGTAKPSEALSRVMVAQQVLGAYDPAEFSRLSDDRQREALSRLWDGWSSRGLAPGDDQAAGGSEFKKLILQGVEDRALTSSTKSIFLGVGVLGYPLDDALWLARTNIRTALDDNILHYPREQRWHTDDHTPEFLGVGPHGQSLVDAWGAATKYARDIARQVETGSRVLPQSSAATPQAAAAFADLVAELHRAGDKEAVDYITGKDPTFTAFLLDVRKPGYYLYNGDETVFARILATRAYAALGAVRIRHSDPGASFGATYLLRPARVVAALRAAATAPAAPGEESIRSALGAYADRLSALVPERPSSQPGDYTFENEHILPGSALTSARNSLARFSVPTRQERYDLPLPLKNLRERISTGNPYMQFSPERWRAFSKVMEACPSLAHSPDEFIVRFVSESRLTNGRLISPYFERGVLGITLNLAALDQIERLRRENPAAMEEELKFLSAAITGALAQPR